MMTLKWFRAEFLLTPVAAVKYHRQHRDRSSRFDSQSWLFIYIFGIRVACIHTD